MKTLRLLFGGILFICLAAAVIFLTTEVMAAPSSAPFRVDPTPTPCIMDGDLEFELETFGDDSFYASETYSDVIIDSSGSTGQFDITITYHGYSARDWFGAPDPIAASVLWRAYSGGSQTGDEVDATTAGTFSNNTVTITHETIRTDGALGISFTYNTPAHSDHAWLTIDSIEYNGLIIEMPCVGCAELTEDDLDGVKLATLMGTDEVGHVIELTEGETYLLFTSPGPWNDGADDQTSAAIRFYDGAAWGTFTAIADYENEDADAKPPCDIEFLEEDYDALAFTALEDMQSIQIRVNDADAAFTDNSGYLNYSLAAATGGYGQSCVGNWSKDNLVGSLTLDSTDDSYNYLQSGSITDGLYALVITGTYDDNGTPSDSVIMADYPALFTSVHDTWDDYNFWTGSEYCEVEGSGVKEYYGSSRNDFYDHDKTLGWGEAKPLGIADDQDSNYSNNSGTVEVEVYTAGYTAPVSDCSTRYDQGTWLDSFVIFADSENGQAIPLQTNGLVPGQTYYIETQGAPYSLNGSDSWDFEAGYAATPGLASSVTWEDPELFFDCEIPLDENLTGYYFVAEEEAIWLRAEYTLGGHEDNSGSIKFNLYGAVPYLVPDDESCSDYLTLDSLIYRDSVDADSTAGFSIDYSAFDADSEYAIKVVSPVYTDPDGTGKTGEIRRAGPGSGSVSYTSFEDWESGTCYEQIDGYDYVYFTAQDLSDYEVRTTEPDGGNTGTMTFEVWELERIAEPVAGCEIRDYGDVDIWWVIKEVGIVYGNNNGDINSNPEVMANSLGSDGTRYKIEIGYIDGVIDIPSQTYNLQISNDSGASWVFLEDWVDCWVDLTGPIARGYYTSPKAGGPFLLRVYDAGGNYLDNTGGLQYKMWADAQDADPGDVGDFYDVVVVGWGAGCSAVCAPPGWLEIGQWIEYARCRLTRWLAWCPWHADAIAKLGDEFNNVEPIGTLLDLVGLGLAVKDEFNLYAWTDDGGGGDFDTMEIQSPQNFLFAPGEGGGADIPLVGPDSIWGGGDIDLHGLDGTSYSTKCDNVLADSLGNLGPPLCFAANVLNTLGLSTWIQWLWDIGMMVGFGFYLNKNWIVPNA